MIVTWEPDRPAGSVDTPRRDTMRNAYTAPTVIALTGALLIGFAATATSSATFVGGIIIGMAVVGAALGLALETYGDSRKARSNLYRQLTATDDHLGKINLDRTMANLDRQKARAKTNGHRSEL